MTAPVFSFSGNGLCSKWGNGDGDALDDWWWETYDASPTVNTDELLYALVVTYLVPAIRTAGHEVEIERIHTIHNPVRARTLDGVEVDHYGGHDYFTPDVWVDITREQIEKVAGVTVITKRNDPWFGGADG
jgi:hypothetical protein